MVGYPLTPSSTNTVRGGDTPYGTLFTFQQLELSQISINKKYLQYKRKAVCRSK